MRTIAGAVPVGAEAKSDSSTEFITTEHFDAGNPRLSSSFLIGSLIVMDRGRMAGLLTFAEVLKALADRGGTLGDLRIADICQAEPLTATPHLDVMELRGAMLERHARYVPVMEGTTLQGVVSFHDVAKAVYEEQSFENRMLKSYIKDWPETGT